MLRLLAFAAALTLATAPVAAGPCKDPKTGKFVKCGTPGARPVG